MFLFYRSSLISFALLYLSIVISFSSLAHRSLVSIYYSSLARSSFAFLCWFLFRCSLILGYLRSLVPRSFYFYSFVALLSLLSSLYILRSSLISFALLLFALFISFLTTLLSYYRSLFSSLAFLTVLCFVHHHFIRSSLFIQTIYPKVIGCKYNG